MKYINKIISFLLRLGLPIGPQALLTVPGRKTGLSRTTPIALNACDDGWQLVSVYGEVDWVKNLRAARSALVTRRLRRVPVTVRELDAHEAAPILRDLVAAIGPLVRPVIGRYFATDPTAPLHAWESEASRHPVFILTPV